MADSSAFVADLDESSTAELYSILGGQLLGSGLGAGARDDDDFRRFGQRWIEDRADAIKSAICGTRVARELSGDFPGDVVDVAALTLPLTGNNQLLALTVAAIVLRRGIATLCAE